ncbi:MAG: hypothetical protein O9340_14275 [Cyclobacteriaceae bacterium]|jgi:hypothetical protein|nr:hypothetical protein [Cyclobacteriaceae bacterium]
MITRLAAFLIAIASHAIAQDSLVYFSDLQFQSNFEKDAFKYINQPGFEPVFNLMLADGKLLNETDVERNRVSYFKILDEIKIKIADKSESKRAKIFISTLKDKYLLQYNKEADFESIFAAGKYNELTATMLYTLGLDYLNIPYQIIIEPANYFVIAYPASNPLRIDSAPSSIVFTSISNEYINQYVQSLRNQKVISEKEFKSKSTRELFDAYYYGMAGQIKLENLISLYYLNTVEKLLGEQKKLQAFEASEKALYISQNARALYFTTNLIAETLLSIPDKNLKHAELLGKLTRYKPEGYSNDVAVGEFLQAGEKLLISGNKKKEYDNYFTKLLSFTYQPKLNEELTTFYHAQYGDYFSQLGEHDSAFFRYDKAISLNKENQNIHLAFIRSLYLLGDQSFTSKTFHERVLASRNKHAQLSNYKQFQQLVGSVLLIQATEAFQSNKPSVGEGILKQFENDKALHVTQMSTIGTAYSAAAIYYFQKNQTQKARDVINRGLLISPDNFELKQRKRMIN